MRIKITIAILLLGGVAACGQVTLGTPSRRPRRRPR